LFEYFFTKATENSTGSRTTIVKPLITLLVVFVMAIPVLLTAKAPDWLIVGAAVIVVIILLVLLFSYLYCLFKEPELLRSENFTIQKLAIEKGLIGDSDAGKLELKNVDYEKEIAETLKLDSSES